MHEVYIVDGSRTPFIKFTGKQGDFSASDLALACSKQLELKYNFFTQIDEVILGCVMPSANEANIARLVALRAGLKVATPAWTVQRNCASGLQAIDSAYQSISLNKANLVLAGGTEAMSRAPMLYSQEFTQFIAELRLAKSLTQKFKILTKFRLNYLAPIIALMQGLHDPIVNLSMGQTAEVLRHQFNITRDKIDNYALESHKRAQLAIDNNYFKDEICSLYNTENLKGQSYDNDTGVRSDANIEKLSQLKPVFDKQFGYVTAGNSSQISGGAALMLIASKKIIDQYNLKPLAKIIDIQWSGVNPEVMGLGPVYAIEKLLKHNNLQCKDIDYWEINEAFAAQVLACLKSPILQIDINKLNIDGGAIAIGHPVGASGARLSLHLAHILKRENKKLGIASLCIGGGQGGAILLENIYA